MIDRKNRFSHESSGFVPNTQLVQLHTLPDHLLGEPQWNKQNTNLDSQSQPAIQANTPRYP